MGNWNQVLNEIQPTPDIVRRKYLREFSETTGRNVVAYYSGWLQKTGRQFGNITSITDEDKAGFMSCFYGLDRKKGLDLVLHSPGGLVTATESIIHYLRAMFADDIRIFVPQIAMSGGTIMALAGKEIWMGKHSNLGPIDPQFGGTPAVTLLEEVAGAMKEMKKDPDTIQKWRPILSQISPTFLTVAKQAIELSHDIAVEALSTGMFKGKDKAEKMAQEVAEELTNSQKHKEHGRHLHVEELQKLNLNIVRLEDHPKLQDALLSMHHAFMITLANSPAAKIIENHDGAAFVKNVGNS